MRPANRPHRHAFAEPATPPRDARHCEQDLADLRFSALLGAEGWNSLPDAIRKRFSKRLKGGATAVYTGRVTEMRMSRAGGILAHMLRFIGAPLPLSVETGVASVVTVTEDAAGGGQNWTRLYANGHGFPQVIHSSKRFAGPGGLEEYIGYGIAMALKISAEKGVLVFRSTAYWIGTRRWRFALPKLLWPGAVEVRHEDLGDGAFRFSLRLTHPLLGELIHQAGIYRDQRL
jgi:hypothetical protein